MQVEFNPARVAGYRLIGYENRLLAKEDFNDDKKDAGEIGAGHTVTALYEIVPAGQTLPDQPSVDPLKYQAPATERSASSDELLNVKLRYKAPDGNKSRLIEFARPSVRGKGLRPGIARLPVRGSRGCLRHETSGLLRRRGYLLAGNPEDRPKESWRRSRQLSRGIPHLGRKGAAT